MIRLTKEDISKIKELKNKKTYQEIADLFNVSISTINYHVNLLHQQRVKDRNRKNILTPKQEKNKNKYQREYRKKRYHEDEEFREKIKKRAREYKRSKKKW